jgi:uncharacterized protein YraI
LTVITAVAMAAPSVTTANVNFRSGPGTNFSAIRTIPVGTSIDIGDCDDAGSWCAVHGRGKEGIRQRPIPEETDDPEVWLRAHETGKGRMVLY